MALSSELTELLTLALRSRAASVPELAGLVGAPVGRVRDGIHALQRQGYLETTDDMIAYRRPEMPVADSTRHTLAAALESLGTAARDVDQALESLPALLQAWDTGGTTERTISGEVMHAQAGPGEAWMLHFARDTPRTCDIGVPDLARLLRAPREQRVADWTAEALATLRVRLLISEHDARDPDLAGPLARLAERGSQVRAHPEPPSFFWVSDREVVGLPLHWGEPWPTSMLTVRSVPVAEAIAARYEQLWSAATPIGTRERSWDSMLALMNQGITIEAAASRLGMAPRTARRRVADAMAHYGAASQFALGAAWGRDRSLNWGE